MDETTVSILLPTFNRLNYLKEAVASCFAQTFRDFEVIVVVDGSSDGTAEYLGTLSDPRLRVRVQANAGLCASLNTAMAMSHGRYLQVLNDDDRLPEKSLEVSTGFLEKHPEVGAVFGEMAYIDSEGNPAGFMRVTDPQEHIRWMGSGWRWSKPMIRKTVAMQVGGYNPEYDRVEDIDYYLRLRATTRLDMISCPLYEYRIYLNSSMRTRMHTFLIPSLKMRLAHLKDGTTRPEEQSGRELYFEKIMMACYLGHPEIVDKVLAIALENKVPYLRLLRFSYRFRNTFVGKKVTLMQLHWNGVKHRVSRLKNLLKRNLSCPGGRRSAS